MRLRQRWLEVELSPGESLESGIRVISVDGSVVVLLVPEELPFTTSKPEVTEIPVEGLALETSEPVRQAENGRLIIDYARDALKELGKWSKIKALIPRMLAAGWQTRARTEMMEDTVRSSLRSDNSGTIIRLEDGRIGLRGWQKPKAEGATAPTPPQRFVSLSGGPSGKDLITQYIQSHHRFTVQNLLSEIRTEHPDANKGTLQAELSRAVRGGKVQRIQVGEYRSNIVKTDNVEPNATEFVSRVDRCEHLDEQNDSADKQNRTGG